MITCSNYNLIFVKKLLFSNCFLIILNSFFYLYRDCTREKKYMDIF